MSDMPPNPLPGHKMPHEDYLNATYGIRSWLLTTDHKRIALLYLGSVTFFFFLGGIFATMIRIHLLTPTGALVTPETYNKLFTMHGVAMIFFFLIPSIPAVLGNFLVPASAFRLGALRHQSGDGSGHAGHRHHSAPCRPRAYVSSRLLQSGSGWRSHPLSTPLLVLFAPGRVHHDSSGHGRDQRDHSHFCAQTDLRILLHRRVEHCHRGHRFPRLGAPHVCYRRIHLCRADLLAPQLSGGDSLGRQGLQLDLDTLQRLHLLGHADALCLRLHRTVFDRRPHWTLPCLPGSGHSHSRHLLRGRPFPLHHGRRRGYGLRRRHSLLVAEDYRQALS